MNIESENKHPEIPRRGDVFVEAFAKGLAVISAFNDSKGPLTLSEVAKRAGLPPASTRRLLYTLVDLGYAKAVEKRFELSPKVMDLGFAYLGSLPFREHAQALLDEFARDVGEVCTVSVLEGNDVFYVARAEVRTSLMRSVGVGGRLAAHATSSGLVLLASLSKPDLDAYLTQAPFPSFTHKTRTQEESILEAIELIRHQGWMLANQELELGICGLAVPIRSVSRATVAALGVSVNLARYSESDIIDTFLPKLKDIAGQLGRVLRH